jgi:hypothetical protein
MATFVLQDPYPVTSVGPVSADLDDYVLNPMLAHGDIIAGGTAGTATRIAGNTSTSTMYLSQTGDGSTAGHPTWVTTGIQGITGSQGIIGSQGAQGLSGTGIQGTSGISIQGIQGIIGSQGTAGSSGNSIQGIAGSQGLSGIASSQGIQGTGGAQGNFGSQGGTGVTGSIGPGVCFQGWFAADHIYYNNALRRDIVRYENDYYLYKGTNGTSAAWNINNWETFGATFNSVATEILFANFGYVDNLGVREFEGVGRTIGDLHGHLATEAPDHVDNAPATLQVETITLEGSEGFANITIDAVTQHCLWNESLTQTAADFAAEHGYANLVLSSDGPKIIFTALEAGTGFSQPSIANYPMDFRGAIKIQGNEMWENVTEDNEHGGIIINGRSWGGGQGYKRFLQIEDGMGSAIAIFSGNITSGQNDLGPAVAIYAPIIYVPFLPTSADGLINGQLWSENGTVKVASV